MEKVIIILSKNVVIVSFPCTMESDDYVKNICLSDGELCRGKTKSKIHC